MVRIKREQVARVSSLTESTWSPWYTALVPRPPSNSGRYESQGEDDDGYIYSEIRERFDGPRYDDGIYELSVKKRGKKRFVVYIGAAHRDGPESLGERILEHFRGDTNVDDRINRAMKLGYTLYVRVQDIDVSEEDVYECEKRYLKKYDYAWNKTNNVRVRKSVPPH